MFPQVSSLLNLHALQIADISLNFDYVHHGFLVGSQEAILWLEGRMVDILDHSGMCY